MGALLLTYLLFYCALLSTFLLLVHQWCLLILVDDDFSDAPSLSLSLCVCCLPLLCLFSVLCYLPTSKEDRYQYGVNQQCYSVMSTATGILFHTKVDGWMDGWRGGNDIIIWCDNIPQQNSYYLYNHIIPSFLHSTLYVYIYSEWVSEWISLVVVCDACILTWTDYHVVERLPVTVAVYYACIHGTKVDWVPLQRKREA